jgi:hypothetical protein
MSAGDKFFVPSVAVIGCALAGAPCCLTVEEREAHIAEWARLTDKKQGVAQLTRHAVYLGGAPLAASVA